LDKALLSQSGKNDVRNLLPGLPLVESPLFPSLLPALGLTEDEARIGLELHLRGYAVLNFPDNDLDGRIERLKANLAPHFNAEFTDPGSEKNKSERRIQDAWKIDDDVLAIAANSQVLSMLGRLYGRPAFPFQTLNFPVGTEQAAHTDIVHFSCQPEKFMCGVWVALEDVETDAGPLFLYPGSHRWPVMSNALIGRRGQGMSLASAQHPFAEAWSALIDAQEAEREVFLARKGQALIWTANLLHGGCTQSDPTLTRWSQVTHYYFEDCLYYTPAYSDETIGVFDLRRITAIHDKTERPNLFFGEPVRSRSNSLHRLNPVNAIALLRQLARRTVN
jgi:hypothetical protein